MIALAIVGTTLIAMLALGNRTIDTGDQLQNLTQATLLAQQKMTEIELDAKADQTMGLQDSEGGFDPPFDRFSWRSRFSATMVNEVKQIVVTVSWGAPERNEAVDLTSFILRLH